MELINVKTWKGLINNAEAKELFELVELAHNNKATKEQKERIIILADLLNNESFNDDAIEQFIDWKELNDGLHEAISQVIP